MKKMLLDVVLGCLTYYIVSVLFTTLIEGTSDVDMLIKSLVPIAIAVAVVFVAFKTVK
jgi:hypothetical protein